jgi:hypothetical protein
MTLDRKFLYDGWNLIAELENRTVMLGFAETTRGEAFLTSPGPNREREHTTVMTGIKQPPPH